MKIKRVKTLNESGIEYYKDATESSVGLGIITALIKNYFPSSTTFAKLDNNTRNHLIEAANDVLDAIYDYNYDQLKIILDRLSSSNPGNFASEFIRGKISDHPLSPILSMDDIAMLAADIGHDVYRTEYNRNGDPGDYLIMKKGYKPEDYCREYYCKIEDLGDIESY